MTFTSPKNGQQKCAQGAQQTPGQIAVSGGPVNCYFDRALRDGDGDEAVSAMWPSAVEAAVDPHMPRRKVEETQHQNAGLGHGGEQGAMLRIDLSAASPRECGLASTLADAPDGVAVGVVGVRLAEDGPAIADQAGIGKSGGDQGFVGAGRTVLAHAFKARAGVVVSQHGWDRVFRVADLEESRSGEDGCGEKERGAGRENNAAAAAGIATGGPEGGNEEDRHGRFDGLEPAPGVLQERHLREQAPNRPRDGKQKKEHHDGDGGQWNPPAEPVIFSTPWTRICPWGPRFGTGRVPRRQQTNRPATATAIIATAIQEAWRRTTSCNASSGLAWCAKSQLFSKL